MGEAESTVSITCEKCNATFTAFLKQMAEHNQRIVCPNCGHAQHPLRDRDPKPAHSKP